MPIRSATQLQKTRKTSSAAAPAPVSTGPVLPTLYSNESGRSYRLDRLIGKGGFGEIYLAGPVPPGSLPPRVCVKISYRLTGWLREAYFAELLAKQARALRVFDRFVQVEPTSTRYCLVMEYAEHGDLSTWLAARGGQPEKFVRHEIAAILETLDVLHRGQALHRDLTPFNVFVCDNETLKLGDFGIATHQASRRGVTADAFNPLGAPTEIAWGKVRKWQQRDDVYQVGQLIAMLLRGDVHSPMRSRDVRRLPCSDHLKEVIHRCLGARGKRYQSAGEMIDALKNAPKQIHKGVVKSLKGRRVSFTGFLNRPRRDAIAAARRSGAVFQASPGPSTDILVRGRPNALQVAGKDGGLKLMEIKRLAARGHRVTVIGEAQFWKLVSRRS
ncbi:MAG TPA: protein kinase [Gemmatimonadales bacterium]|nr:protein kinase [Gemmatimonadales bacterium]